MRCGIEGLLILDRVNGSTLDHEPSAGTDGANEEGGEAVRDLVPRTHPRSTRQAAVPAPARSQITYYLKLCISECKEGEQGGDGRTTWTRCGVVDVAFRAVCRQCGCGRVEGNVRL